MLTIMTVITLLVYPAMFDADFLDYAAHIYAGETLPGSDTANAWIVCTILRDAYRIQEVGGSVYALHPGRWNGWKEPTQAQREFVESVDCSKVPMCAFVGNMNDYSLWRRSFSADVTSLVTGNEHGIVVCVPAETVVYKHLTMN